MHPTSLLVPLSIWASTAHAFYPFDPEWHQNLVKEDRSKRGINNPEADGVAFDIKQRGDLSEASTAERAARDAERLSKRYGGQVADSKPGNTIVERNNQYTVMTAANPGKPMSEGIDQDGTDYSYFVQVQLGSANTELYMLVDTGAGSTWVMGSSCSSKACAVHNTFNSAGSSSYKSEKDNFSVSYGSGSVSGTLATDTIGLAGVSFNYEFGVANQTSDDFLNFAFDGIIGLSRGKGANENFLQTLKNDQKLDQNLFAIALNRASDGTDTAEISFGTIDDSKYTGDITYTNTGNANDWSIEIDDISYNGNKAGVGGVQSYIDTGTSFIFGPPDLVKKIHAVIPSAKSSDGVTYTVPCNSDQSLSFSFSGTSFDVSPKDWISPPGKDGSCTSNIYGQEVVAGAWLLGDTFLKNVYAIFDMDKSRIGFGTLATQATTSTTSGSSLSPSSTSTPNNGTASITRTSVTAPTAQPGLGLSGHETQDAKGTAAAETSSPKHTGAAAAGQVQNARYASAACLLSFLAFLA